MDIGQKCSLCDKDDESILHVFYECDVVRNFWLMLSNHLGFLDNSYTFTKRDIIFYFTHKQKCIEFVTNFFYTYIQTLHSQTEI